MDFSQNQVDALSNNFLHDFERRAIEHFQENFPAKVASKTFDQLLAWFRKTMSRSEEYGLESEYEIVCYADLSLIFGDEFENQPEFEWASDILNADNIGSAEKADLLFDFAEFSLNQKD